MCQTHVSVFVSLFLLCLFSSQEEIDWIASVTQDSSKQVLNLFSNERKVFHEPGFWLHFKSETWKKNKMDALQRGVRVRSLSLSLSLLYLYRLLLFLPPFWAHKSYREGGKSRGGGWRHRKPHIYVEARVLFLALYIEGGCSNDKPSVKGKKIS